MRVLGSLLLFALAAVTEIGGAWLIWQGLREHRGWVWVVLGGLALAGYGLVATLQPDPHFGRVLAGTAGCSWRRRCSGGYSPTGSARTGSR